MAHTVANYYVKNPIILEVFNADIDIGYSAHGKERAPVHVSMISFYSAAAGDVFALQDEFGDAAHVVVCLAQNISGGSVSQYFGSDGQIFPSLVFDNDLINSGLSSGDRVLIYLK